MAQLFHLCILGWHDANSDLRRLAQVRSIERNRRNRPTPQSLLGFLAQTLEEPIFHYIPSSATLPFMIGPGGRPPLLDHLVGAPRAVDDCPTISSDSRAPLLRAWA